MLMRVHSFTRRLTSSSKSGSRGASSSCIRQSTLQQHQPNQYFASPLMNSITVVQYSTSEQQSTNTTTSTSTTTKSEEKTHFVSRVTNKNNKVFNSRYTNRSHSNTSSDDNKPFIKENQQPRQQKTKSSNYHQHQHQHQQHHHRQTQHTTKEQEKVNKELMSQSAKFRSMTNPPPVLFEKSIQTAKTLSPPNNLTFVLLYEMSARFGLEQVRLVDELIEETKDDSFKKSPYIFSSKLNAHIKARDPQTALKLFEVMCTGNEPQIQPDTLIYNLVLTAYMQLGKEEQVFQTVEIMRLNNVRPNVRTLAMLIEFFVNVNEPQRALSLFEEFGKSDEIITDIVSPKYLRETSVKEVDTRSMVFNMLLKSLIAKSKGDNLHFVTQLFNTVRVQHLNNVTHGKVSNAIIDTVSYNTMLKAYYGKGSFWEAKKLLHQLLDDSKIDPSLTMTLHTYNTIMNSLVQKGRLEAALEVFDAMAVKPNVFTFACLLNGCANVENINKAHEIFSLAVRSGIEPDVSLCSSMMKVFGVCGKVEDALRFIETMKQMGVMPNGWCYTGLFKAFRRVMEFDRAWQYYQSIDHPYDVDMHFVSCMSHLVRNESHLNEVFKMYESVKQNSIFRKRDGKELLNFDLKEDRLKIDSFYKRVLRETIYLSDREKTLEIFKDIARTMSMTTAEMAGLLDYFLKLELDAKQVVGAVDMKIAALNIMFGNDSYSLIQFPKNDAVRSVVRGFISRLDAADAQKVKTPQLFMEHRTAADESAE